jgi:hypothetical protein
MSFLCYVMLVCFGSLWLEAASASAGFAAPALVSAVMYFSCCFGWRAALALGITSGWALAGLFAGGYLTAPLSLAAAGLLGAFWIRKAGADSIMMLCVPGAVGGALYLAPPFLEALLHGPGLGRLVYLSAVTGAGVLLSALLLPAYAAALDLAGDWFGFTTYRKARGAILGKD